MFEPEQIEWLDALGSVSVEFDRDSGKLQIRGLPCHDFQHRGFDLRQDGESYAACNTLGKEIGRFSGWGEALVGAARVVGRLDLGAPPPALGGVPPAAARACRDWSVHVACFPTFVCVERDDTVEALLDAVAAGQLALIQGLPGAGSHAVINGLARRLASGCSVPPGLVGSRVLELDWLKLSSSQTQAGAFGPGERLAQVLAEVTLHGHIPIIPRGRAQELARVLPAGLAGVAFCGSNVETNMLAAMADVVIVRLPDLSAHQLQAVLQAAVQALQAELAVVIPTETIQYLLQYAASGKGDRTGPTIYQVAPGALVTLLRLACQRGLLVAPQGAGSAARAVITPSIVETGLLQVSTSQGELLRTLMLSLDPSVGSGEEANKPTER